ncbi:hypothetical protein Trco_006758 [Trichoderma cornu-damae]|uniref:Uncharacterized protein n=1 Tax=Trichoderma cornu-damae TaxID=654480 RepID=A0A9P8QFL6_9HYPO|nr:hypothetical protein Trco_006758 [Trichoderma cornu-damae]
MLETIASSLRDISAFGSSDPAAASSKRNLWTSLVQSYRPRLNDYMMQAKRTLKETTLHAGGQVETLALDDQTPTLLARLEEFRTLVNVVASSPTQDGLGEVIKSAHDVFSSYKEHDFDEIVGSKAETRSLRDALGFLGAVIFKYVGCSKRSCFLCSRVVQRYGSYTTRGCHGKLYNLWTVPEVPWLAEEERPKLVQALKNVERAMKESIRDGKTSGLVHARESTIGGSSVATRRQQSGRDPYMSSLVSEYLRSQRQEGMRRSSAGKGEDFASPDKRCQDRMSFYHLAKCSARSITTADILCKDVIGDEFPQDPETREHFGFNRCRDWREQSHLLGLYKGLIYLEVEAIQLNEWREKDILVSKIIETFSKVSEQSRGGYFPWFLRNQHILDNSIPPLQFDGQDNPLQRAIDAARPYLDLEDRNKDLQQLEPPSKRQCFLLYAMALDGSHPNPHWAEFDSWYDFGFAVCPGEHNERLLGGLYSRLVGGHKVMRDYYQSLGSKDEYPNVPTCSFNEFWLAYESGSLAKLFYHYGLGDMMDRDWGLREFLSFPLDQHELRPSVWRLKHFLALDPGAPLGRLSKIETAAQEYGFTSQLTARTRLALRQFYEQLFTKVNPLRVHEAKNRGKLLEYAESSLDVIDDGVRHVLRKLG